MKKDACKARLSLSALNLAAVLVAVSTLIACGSNEVVYLDLVAQADSARKPPTAVKLNAEQLQGSSDQWWAVENPGEATPFAWVRSKVVRLDLDLAGASPLELSFRCWPFTWPGAPGQGVEIVFNETVVADLEIRPRKSTYSVNIPPEATYRGSNRLELRFDHVGRPADHAERSTDMRTLAAAFEYLSIAPKDGSVESAAPGSLSEETLGGLTMVAGNRLIFSTRVAKGWYLDLGAVSDESPLRADVWVRVGGGPETVLVSQRLNDDAPMQCRLDLSDFAGYAVEIGLGASADHDSLSGAGVRWTKAAIVGPPGGLPKQDNVILIVVDTLRADRLAAYGGPAKSPNIDNLMAKGARFEWAYSHVPITGPSHSSLFTSLLPTEHGVHNNSQVLSDDVTTLAEVLKAAGYATGAFVSLGVLDSRFGFAQGFDHFDDNFRGGWMRHAGEINQAVKPWLEAQGNDPLFLWVHYSDPHEPYAPPTISYPGVQVFSGDTEIGRLEANGRSTDFEIDLPPGSSTIRLVATDSSAEGRYRFTYLGFADQGVSFNLGEGWTTTERRFGPSPFNTTLPATLEIDNSHPGPLNTKFILTCKERLTIPEIRDRYVDEIEYLDKKLGELLDALEAKGVLEDSLVIFAADHGEGLGDHNHVGHISQLYDSLIRVPVSVTYRGRVKAGTVIDSRVGLVDLFPTVLDALGIAAPNRFDGHSLMPLMDGDTAGADHPLVAVTFKPEAASDKKAIILGGFKYIHSSSDREWEELYDLRSDPDENQDLVNSDTETLNRLRAELEALLSVSTGAGSPAEQADLSEEDRARLRELGYIH